MPAGRSTKFITFDPLVDSPDTVEGVWYYDAGSNAFYYYNGTSWRQLTSAAL